MNLLQNEFIKQLSMTVLGTLLFTANCAFVLLPGALGGTPGRPHAPNAVTLPAAMTQAEAGTTGPLAQLEDENSLN